MKFFRPILAGATLRDRLVACLGACMGIGLTTLVGRLTMGHLDPIHAVLIGAPLGASAVLMFVVPASPLTQPWPVIGGNVVSALTGIAVARLVPDPVLASGLAVGLAIGLMSLTRCLHPPGGGTALLCALAAPTGAAHDFLFAFAPMGLNAVCLVAAAWVFHRFSGHTYPHKPLPAPAAPPPVEDVDIDAALSAMEALDVSRGDLKALIRLSLDNAQRRRAGR